MDPNVTLRPVDKLTADEWRAERADRVRKEALYGSLAVRLAFIDAHPHKSCEACGKRHPIDQMLDSLCPICGAWAGAAIKRLADIERTRKLRMQLAVCDLLLMLDSTQRNSMTLRSERLHRISLAPFEEMQSAARTANA